MFFYPAGIFPLSSFITKQGKKKDNFLHYPKTAASGPGATKRIG